jgi:hypothetical protein
MDLQRMAKHKPYVEGREQSIWFKIPNRAYSEMQVRKKLFERDQTGWQCCVLACAEFESQTTLNGKAAKSLKKFSRCSRLSMFKNDQRAISAQCSDCRSELCESHTENLWGVPLNLLPAFFLFH